ncbi:MAG: hypothetical protein ACI9K2_003972 [Myxococcota bacterium]|jgi:hypothetical protein
MADSSRLRARLRGSRDDTPLTIKHPGEHPFQLSSGRTLMLPERVEKASSVALLGAVDRSVVDAIAEPFGLRAVPMTRSTGMGGVFMIDYEQATFGKHQEALFVLAVQPRAARSKLRALTHLRALGDLASTFAPVIARSDRQAGFLLRKIYVNQPELALMGREV